MRKLMAVILCLIPTMASADEAWLTDTEMNQRFAGATVTGLYFWGVVYTETYNPDGSISYWDPTYGAIKGRWHFSKQGFCTFYEGIEGGCFALRRVGDNCFENYLLEAQDSGPLKPGESKPYVSQFWRTDAASTCEAKTS